MRAIRYLLFLLLALFAGLAFSLAWGTTPVWAQPASWKVEAGDVVYGVALSADGSVQVVGSRNNRVVALDQTGKQLWEFHPKGTVWGVATSGDGTRTAVASEDRRVYLLDAQGQPVWQYRGSFIFLGVAIARDGSLVAAVAEDRSVYALDGATGKLLWRYRLPNVADTVAVYGTGTVRVLVGTRDSQVHLFSPKGIELWRAQLADAVKGVAAVQSGALVVAGTQDGVVTLLNGATAEALWQIQLPGRVSAIAITDDGGLILVGTREGKLYVLNGEDGSIQQTHDIGSAVETVAMSPDGRYFVAGTRAGQAVFQDMAAARAQFIARQRLFTGLRIGIPLALLGLLAGLAVWIRVTPSGRTFWDVKAAPGRRLVVEIWRSRISYLFLLPTVALLLVFNYYPAFSGLYHAFTVWKPGVETRWVGLQQFRFLMKDQYFWVGIKNALILVVTGYIKTFTVPLLVAELIFHIRNSSVRYGLRSLFVIPLVVPGVVGILLWVNIYDPNIGLLNQTLRALGLDQMTRVWLGDEKVALWSIIAIGFPWVSPFALLIFYGGLISIPQELFDAVKVDGASAWTRFWRLDLPLLMSQIKLLLILGFIGGVQEFQLIFLTTGGGPGNVTYTPALELYYQAMRFNNFGLASAIGAVLFLVILGGTIINMRYVQSAVEYQA
ncbi:MAG: PQQ-binding-like beta-propeller repeat protein [Anaerolineae bacterium]|nr:PQQ-binding-like beta-propeller repeat protein [Anaerolineae bacterium]